MASGNTAAKRIRIDDDTFDILTALSTASGHDLDTVLQLLAEEHNGSTGADRLAARTALDDVATDYLTLREIVSAAAPDLRVAGIRLGPLSESVLSEEDGLFDRDQMGARLTTGEPQLWLSTRGVWKISTKPNAIAAYRLGTFLGLYCGVTWSGRSHPDHRRWALTGYRIEGSDRINPEDGAVLGAATPQEQALFDVLSQHRLGLPSAASNPIVNLYHS